jgi:hypothetical protein
MTKIKAWFKKRLIDPIKGQLVQGYSVEKVAMSIAVGLAIGCTPIIGISTVLGIILATVFSLNHVVLQTINYIVYPLHLAMIIPFLMLGQRVFADTVVPLNLSRMFAEFGNSPALFFKTYGLVALYGFLLWVLTLPIIIPVTYFIVKPIIHGLKKVSKIAHPKV